MTLGKILAAGVAAITPAVLVTAPAAQAANDKVVVCHWSHGSGYVPITVSARAADVHLTRHHDDFLPVAGDCEQVPVLAQVTGVDGAGNEFLIAQLEDTTADGSVSEGDTVRVHRHPTEFDSSNAVPSSGKFDVTEHAITKVDSAETDLVIVESAEGVFWFYDTVAVESFVEMAPGGFATLFVDMVGGFGGFNEKDLIQLSAHSPSEPSGIAGGGELAQSEKTVEFDDAWLEVDISL